MTIRKDPLTEHGAIETAAHQVGGWGRAGDIIGKPDKWVRDAANPYLEGRHASVFTLRMAAELTRAGAQSFVDYLVRESGGKLVAVPDAAPAANLFSALGSLGKESGEAMSVIAEALADGKLTPGEKANIRREVLDVQATLTTLLRMMDDEGRIGDGA